MLNNSENDFDLKIKSILDEAREEVPEHVWCAVSGRVTHPDAAHAARWKWALVACVAAVSTVLVLILAPDRATVSTVTVNPALADQIAVEAPGIVVEAEPVGETVPKVRITTDAAAFSSPATAAVSSKTGTDKCNPGTEVETKEAETTEEDNAPEQVSKPSGKKPVVNDPFSQTAFENGRNYTAALRTPSFDIRGKVGTNDRTDAGAAPSGRPFASSRSDVKGLSSNVSESSESIYSIPVTFGLGIRFPLSERISLGTGIDYSTLSRRFDGTYTEVGDNGKVERTVKGKVAHNVSYIGVPINVYYNLLSSNLMDFYAFGGGEVEKCMVNRYRISENGSDVTFNDAAKGVQLSVGLGMGVSINISDLISIYADPNIRYYFDCAQPKTIRKQQPLIFGLDLGLRFNL